MLLRTIGTGTVSPVAQRGGPAHWVEAGGARLLLDCGPGTLRRAAELELPLGTLTHVVLSHYHADHWCELPALLSTLKWGMEPGRLAPLTVLGPGIGRRMAAMASAMGDWVLEPGYPLVLVDLAPQDERDLGGGVRLACHPTPHTEDSVALAIHHGGHRLVYTGDTGVSPELAAWARGADLLLAECSLPDDRAVAIHLTPAQAGELARAAEVKSLVLTHFYPPVETVDPARLAAGIFRGPVVAARDGDRFLIGA